VLKPEYIYKALAPDARASELMTRFVLAKGVDVNTPHDKWGTPLHFAIYQRREAKVKLLLDAGADPSTKTTGRNYPGKTPAELALSKGYTGMLAGLRQRVRTPANDNRAQAAAGGELLGL
jgi:ankyrin repeat protein